MSPREYLKKHEKKQIEALCSACGTTYAYFRVVAYGRGKFSAPLARKFHEKTDGELSMYEHRPDIFGEATA